MTMISKDCCTRVVLSVTGIKPNLSFCLRNQQRFGGRSLSDFSHMVHLGLGVVVSDSLSLVSHLRLIMDSHPDERPAKRFKVYAHCAQRQRMLTSHPCLARVLQEYSEGRAPPVRTQPDKI